MPAPKAPSDVGPPAVQRFSGGGIHGELAVAYSGDDLARDVAATIDAGQAVETIHWGRNYLFATVFDSGSERMSVVVKQFRNQGRLAMLERRLRGSKAERSWRVAAELVRARLDTPQPVALVESDRPDGPSFFIARRLEDAAEIRHFFRRLNGSEDAGEFPDVEPLAFLAQLGRLVRRIHDAGIVYRDLSMGNVLAVETADGVDLFLVDFNRARTDIEQARDFLVRLARAERLQHFAFTLA